MDMELNIIIKGLNIDITPVVREDKIKAFVQWIFKTDQGDIKIKGGTIKLQDSKDKTKQFLSYNPPAIRSGFGKFFWAFWMDDKDLFRDLCSATIKKYASITGEPTNITSIENEEVDIDDLPI